MLAIAKGAVGVGLGLGLGVGLDSGEIEAVRLLVVSVHAVVSRASVVSNAVALQAVVPITELSAAWSKHQLGS